MVKCFVEGTRNNVFVTVLDNEKMLLKGSIGVTGYKGSKKKSEFGGEQLGKMVGKELLKLGVMTVDVSVSGCWEWGENSCVWGIMWSGVNINYINLILRTAHNGVWLAKMKRR